MRTLLAIALVLALAPAARAVELHLDASGGVGLVVMDECPTADPYCADGTRHRLFGPAPSFGVGLRWTQSYDLDWRIRYGVRAAASTVHANPSNHGEFAGALGEIGLENGSLSVDLGAGLTLIQLREGDFYEHGGSFAFAFSAAVRLSDSLALVGHADLAAMMHGTAAAGFLGVGLEWRP